MRGDLATRLAGSRDAVPRRAAADEERQFHRRARRLHARRSRLLCAQAQRGQRRKQSRRHQRQLFLEPRRRGPERRSREIDARARARHAQSASRLLFVARGTPMLAMGVGDRPQPARQQQRLRPGQRDHPGSTGARPTPRSPPSSAGCAALRSAHPALRPLAWLTGEPLDERSVRDVEWRDAEGPMTSGAQWDARPATRLSRSSPRPSPTGSSASRSRFNRGADEPQLHACPTPREASPGACRLDTSDDAVGRRADRARATASSWRRARR